MEALLVNAVEQLTAIMMELVAEHEQLLHLGQQKKICGAQRDSKIAAVS